MSAQDYQAASEEIRTNLEVRRLVFVVMHILLPGGFLAVADCLSGTEYPEAVAWLPHHVITVVGLIIALVGIVASAVLMRCHFGMVVNGTKMRQVTSGDARAQPLNIRGVTTNFVALNGLSAAMGLGLFLVAFVHPLAALLAGLGLFIAIFFGLVHNHGRANRLVAACVASWETRPVAAEVREHHTQESLDAANQDIAIVATMAAALFVGLFTSMVGLAGIDPRVQASLPAATIKEWAVPLCSGYLFISLWLSASMVQRLRQAIGSFSLELAALRSESDDPWRFSPWERTFLLYALILVLQAAATAFLVWPAGGAPAAAIAALAMFSLGVARHALNLRLWRKKMPPQVKAATAPTPG